MKEASILFLGRCVTFPTPRLVNILGANDDPLALPGFALCSVGWIATDDTDGERFRNILSHGEQLGHGFKGLPQIILVESRNDDAFPLVCQGLTDADEIWFEELPLVYPDNLSILRSSEDFRGIFDDLGYQRLITMGNDVLRTVACVYARLENGDPLTGYLGAAETAYELFGLPAEHAAADDFDPADITWYVVEL